MTDLFSPAGVAPAAYADGFGYCVTGLAQVPMWTGVHIGHFITPLEIRQSVLLAYFPLDPLKLFGLTHLLARVFSQIKGVSD